MTTGILYDERFLLHRAPYEHPEHPGRLAAIHDRLEEEGLLARCETVAAREATREELERIHTPAHLRTIAETAKRDFTQLDPDTYACRDSAKAALLAAGGLVDLALAVAEGRLENGLALLRPPGHHAEADRAMGFCLFNNVAVAARAAQNQGVARAAQNQGIARAAQNQGIARAIQAAGAAKAAPSEGVERVLIVDWDLHHGNGTQHSFWEDPTVLYFSTHQFPFYPGTGAIDEIGGGAGRGFTLNVPLPAGCGDAEYLAAFDRILLPVARDFAPDLVLVSAGYDAADGDLLGSMRITPDGYARLTQRLLGLAGGRVVLALEGGYNLDAIARSAEASLRALLGAPDDGRQEMSGDESLRPQPAPAVSRILDAVLRARERAS
ncbi:MAG TPA: histone deacetylase [Thermoanaerobaculia bacterium]